MRATRRAGFFIAAGFLAGCQGQGDICACPPIGPTSISQTVNVLQASQVTIPAGLAVATITFPAASSGSGTLQLTGSTVLPTPGPSATGATSTVSIPGTAIAAITIATSMSATYATLPTFSFALPAATNESYELYIDDPATGVPLFPVGAYTATSSATGVTLTAQTAPIAAPYPAGAPPILPITYDANNTVGFVLYETPATN